MLLYSITITTRSKARVPNNYCISNHIFRPYQAPSLRLIVLFVLFVYPQYYISNKSTATYIE